MVDNSFTSKNARKIIQTTQNGGNHKNEIFGLLDFTRHFVFTI